MLTVLISANESIIPEGSAMKAVMKIWASVKLPRRSLQEKINKTSKFTTVMLLCHTHS
jgi:hypothetical protein